MERKPDNFGRVFAGAVYGGLAAVGVGFTAAGFWEMAKIDLNPNNDPEPLNVSRIAQRQKEEEKGTDKAVTGLIILGTLSLLIPEKKD